MRSTCPYLDCCILDANTSQVGGAGLLQASIITGGRGRSLTGRHHHKWAGQVSQAGIIKWAEQVFHWQASLQVGGQVSHRQASSQVGGAGLSQAGIIAGGWGRSFTGRHHHKWAGQISQAGITGGRGRWAGIIAVGWGRSFTGRLF